MSSPDAIPGSVMPSTSLANKAQYLAIIATIHGSGAYNNFVTGWKRYLTSETDPWAPTNMKTYDVVPKHPVRFFYPPGYDRTAADAKPLPTMFTIHGGGWAVGEPAEDAECNRRLSDKSGMLIVSMGYTLALSGPFPTAINELTALYLAIVDDDSLHIDHTRIAVAGFSAGGNLALAISQDPAIRAHKAAPRAAVPVYPALDQVGCHQDTSKRPYKTSLTGIRGTPVEFLKQFSDAFLWAYLPPGTDLSDPRVSPFYAPRENLPPHIFIVGAELDILSHDGWAFAYKMSGKEVPEVEIVGGKEVREPYKLELEDPRYNFECKEAGIRWMLVPDVVHAFDFGHIGMVLGDEESKKDGAIKTELYMDEVVKWLQGVGF